jgi:hypothetical protein
VIRNCSTAENTTHAANGSEALQTILDAYVIGTSRISVANWCPMRCRLSSGLLTNLGNQAVVSMSTTSGVILRHNSLERLNLADSGGGGGGKRLRYIIPTEALVKEGAQKGAQMLQAANPGRDVITAAEVTYITSYCLAALSERLL